MSPRPGGRRRACIAEEQVHRRGAEDAEKSRCQGMDRLLRHTQEGCGQIPAATARWIFSPIHSTRDRAGWDGPSRAGSPSFKVGVVSPSRVESPMNSIFPIFFVVWVFLSIGSALFFLLNRNAPLKRRVLPPFLISTGVIFIGFVWLSGAPPAFLLIAVPGVALISFLNIRCIKFCDACGRTIHNQNPFSPSKFCSKCGAPIQ